MSQPDTDKRAKLIDLVLKQILKDILNGDFTALEILLDKIPTPHLEAYLSEEDQNETI